MAGLIFNNGSMKIGYNGEPWTFSEGSGDSFMSTVEPTTRPVGEFRDEAVIACKEMAQTFQGERLYALYSGGIDSEAMLEAFKLAKVPVTVVLIEFTDGSNEHDMKHARDYLKRTVYTGPVKVVKFDVKGWFASQELFDYARHVQTVDILFTPLLKVIEDNLLDGIAVTAHEEPTLWRNDALKGKWVWNRCERHYALHKMFMRAGRSGVPAFFQWSSELLASFMFNKQYRAAYNRLHNPTLWQAESLKYFFYWEQFKLPQRIKYTGFESLITEITQRGDEYLATLPHRWDRELNTEVFEWAKQVNYREAR